MNLDLLAAKVMLNGEIEVPIDDLNFSQYQELAERFCIAADFLGGKGVWLLRFDESLMPCNP